MKDTIIKLTGGSVGIFKSDFKSMIITDQQVSFSSKSYTDKDALLNTKGGLLEQVLHIQIANVSEINHNQEDEGLKLVFDDELGKSKKTSVSFEDKASAQAAIESLASAAKMKKIETPESPTKPLLTSAFYMLMAAGLIFTLTSYAAENAAGIEHEFTGRRSGVGRLMFSVAGMLGTTGSWLIGLAVMAFIGYKAYSRFKSPLSDIKYIR